LQGCAPASVAARWLLRYLEEAATIAEAVMLAAWLAALGGDGHAGAVRTIRGAAGQSSPNSRSAHFVR
jgi:hypothetical protein